MDLINVLKNLKVIYGHALGNKWHIILPALKLQARYASLFEKQYRLPQCPPTVMRKTSRVDQQRRDRGVDVAKLGLALRHPPPVGA